VRRISFVPTHAAPPGPDATSASAPCPSHAGPPASTREALGPVRSRGPRPLPIAWLRAGVAADAPGRAVVTRFVHGCAAAGRGDARRVGGGPATVAVGTGDLTGQRTGAVVRHANRRAVRGCRVRRAIIDRRPPPGIRTRWGSCGSPIRRGLQRRSHARRHRVTTRVRMPLGLRDMALRAYHPDMTVRMKTPCT